MCACVCVCIYVHTFVGLLYIVSKSEKAKVTKLFHRLETNDSGVVPLFIVTRLFHFRNNALVKLVTTQYASKQDTVVGDNTDEDSNSKEVLDLEKFVELFDILSPKKNSLSKSKGMQYEHACTICVDIVYVPGWKQWADSYIFIIRYGIS